MKILLIFITLTITITSQHFASGFVVPPNQPSPGNQFLQCLQSNVTSLSFPPNYPISKALYTPQNASFLPTLQAYIKNSRFNRPTTPKPLALVAATHYSHVQAAVSCARVSGVQLRIRSGGHDYEGMSYVSNVSFVVLDMFNLRQVNVDVGNRVASVQAGAILGDIYYNVAKMSNNTLAFPGGVCFTVGVGGHISGGGYGPLMRMYGLSVDNVIDAQVVDANSRLLTRATMGEDLFWAIRGGGAASYAVVLSWTLRLVPVPLTVTTFTVVKTLEQGATDVVDQWQRVAPNLDPKLFIRAQPEVTPATARNKATVRVSFIALYLGGAQELVGIVNSSFPLLGLQLKDCIQMSWAQSLLYWYTGPNIGIPLETMLQRSSSSNRYSKFKSDYVKQPIPKTGWEAIWKKMIELGPNVFMQYNPYGGRMNEIASDATPFPHRARNIFKMLYLSYWGDPSLDAENRYLKGMRELYDLFTPYVSMNPREAFLNYRDIDTGTNANGDLGFAYGYFKDNVARMQKVKGDVDPSGFFKYEQSIPV